jgi:hypothetical protein
MPMTVKDIVKEYLIANGYDGLVTDLEECACDVSDLIPCCEPCELCQAGHKVPCDCGEEHEFHIVAGKKGT